MSPVASNSQGASLVHHFLERSAIASPEKTAVIHEGRRSSYAEINARANRLAHWLAANGICKEDRVALFLENSVDYIAGYYGVLKVGGIAAPLSTDLKAAALENIIAELSPKVAISTRRFEKEIQQLDPVLLKKMKLIVRSPQNGWVFSNRTFTWEEACGSGPTHNPEVPIDAADLASIIYTSGSTATPKGVMLNHNNIVANTNSICRYLRINATDIQMVVLPFHYVMGKSLLNTHFAAGATVIINNTFAFPASVVNQMADENATAFSGVPSTFAYLLNRSPLKKFRDRLSTLRYCSQAGGHMAMQLKHDLRDALPAHTEIFIMYGATEASARLAYLDPEMYHAKMGAIGKAIPGVTLRVLDPNGNELPAGREGELVATGANIMKGYWKDTEATAAALTEHGYHTGDYGYKDKDGFFFLTGRRDQMLKVGGHRVNLQEVEEGLLATGKLIEAVVIGIPDPLLGHLLAALVVGKNRQVDEQDILATSSRRLPRFKLPGRIKQVRSLPKNSSGKIDREKCREMLTS